ncbi:MAG: lipocalin family protein [Sphaerochaeta sp.]
MPTRSPQGAGYLTLLSSHSLGNGTMVMLVLLSLRWGMKPERKALNTVPLLDLERYLGHCYEIARFAHGFERKLGGVTAQCSPCSGGRIQVVNSGFRHKTGGTYTKVKVIA